MLQNYMPMISTILSLFAADYFYCTILTKRSFIKNMKAVLCIFNLIFVVLYLAMQSFAFSKSLLGISFLLFPCILFFEDDLSHRVCAFFSALSVMIVSEMLVSSIFLIANTFFPKLSWSPSTMVERGNIITLIAFVLLLFSLQLFFSYKLAQTLKDYFIFLRPSLLLKTGCSIIFLLLSQNMFAACDDSQSVLFYTPVYFTLIIFSLLLFNNALKRLSAESEHIASIQIRKQYAEQQLRYLQENTQKYQHIRRWNHDISNHLLSLSYLINSDKTSEAMQYIDFLLTEHTKEHSHEIP